MQPRAEEIHRILATFIRAKRAGTSDLRRREFGLVVQGSSSLLAEVRELRATCAMIDIGSSIYTLAFTDILGIDPVPAAQGGLRITVRPGCFASHVAARLRRTAPRSWSATSTVPKLPVRDADPFDSYVREADTNSTSRLNTNDGAAEGDPTESESARHELVVNDAVRTGKS